LPTSLALRPDASTTPSFPTVDPTLDPRTFGPTGTYTPGAARLPTALLTQGHLLVADDGRLVELPPCAYPLPAPGHASADGIKIDGDLSDWPLGALIGIDQAGDGAGGKDYLDLRELYFASDATSYYLAARVTGTWPATSISGALQIQFSSLALPTDGTTDPTPTLAAEFGVYGSDLYQFTPNPGAKKLKPGTGPGELDFQLAASGQVIELRLPRSAIDPLLGSGPFVLNMETACDIGAPDCPHAPYRDGVGAHIVGLIDDYACLVPLPDPSGALTSFKMFVMRHQQGTDPQKAEQEYRAMIAAAPTDEFVGQPMTPSPSLRSWIWTPPGYIPAARASICTTSPRAASVTTSGRISSTSRPTSTSTGSTAWTTTCRTTTGCMKAIANGWPAKPSPAITALASPSSSWRPICSNLWTASGTTGWS
jgi:hypothetical protein